MLNQMVKVYSTLLLCLCATACQPSQVMQHDIYGVFEESAMDIIPVEAVLAEPSLYQARNLVIEGTIHEVCQMEGCWFTLRSIETSEGLRVLVESKENGDYKFVVPMDISGRHVVVRGTLAELDESTDIHHPSHASEKAPLLTLTATGVRVSPEKTL